MDFRSGVREGTAAPGGLAARLAAPAGRHVAGRFIGLLRVSAGYRLPLVLLGSLLLGLTEGAGLLLLLRIIQAAGVGAAVPGGVATPVDVAIGPWAVPLLYVLVGAIALMAAGGFVAWRQRVLAADIQQRVSDRLRNDLYARLISTQNRRLSAIPRARLMHALMGQPERAAMLVTHALSVATFFFLLIIYGVLVATIDSRFLVAAALAAVPYLVVRRRVAVSRAGRRLESESAALLQEADAVIDLHKLILLRESAPFFQARFGQITRTYREAHVRVTNAVQRFSFYTNLVVAVWLGVMLVVGLRVLALPLLEVALVLGACARIAVRLGSVHASVTIARSVLPALDAQFELELALPRESGSVEPHTSRPPGPPRADAAERGRLLDAPAHAGPLIRLAGVGFRLDGEDAWLLQDIDLTIERGVTALVGPSGVGKTTLGDIIAGLLPPTAGQLLHRDLPLEGARLADWRRGIGYAPQEPTFVRGTIRDNLLLGREGVTDEWLMECLDLVGAADFVGARAGGLDTTIADRGRSFSGGELQRLNVTRALVAARHMLILDEPSSNLDERLTRRLGGVLKAVSERLAVVVLTHDPLLMAEADRVYDVGQRRFVSVLPFPSRSHGVV
jgi:ATP-binding cassette, subfamily C, bacterial